MGTDPIKRTMLRLCKGNANRTKCLALDFLASSKTGTNSQSFLILDEERRAPRGFLASSGYATISNKPEIFVLIETSKVKQPEVEFGFPLRCCDSGATPSKAHRQPSSICGL